MYMYMIHVHVYDILKALVHLLNILIMCVRTCTTKNTFFFISNMVLLSYGNEKSVIRR